jgi:putative oxidoreductase
MRWLSSWSGPIYALLRIVVGLLFLQHGTQKLFGWPPGGHGSPEPWTQMWIGAVLELTLGVLVAIGLFTSIAAFVASGEMAVAYFQFHQPKGALPVQNGGELAVVYCFVFLYIAAHGAGKWSADAARSRSTA